MERSRLRASTGMRYALLNPRSPDALRKHISSLKEVAPGITMIDEEIKKLIDEQNNKLQQVFTRSDLQSALSALEKLDLDDLLIIDIGSENPIFGKIVLSKEFGVIVDSGAGRYYYLIPKEAIRSIQFAPKNGELQQLLEKQKA